MQHEITQAGPLLNHDGILAQKGWAKELLLSYKRSDIKASPFRIKEWDYYCILQKDYGIAITVADNSYMSLYAINVYDFTTNKVFSYIVMVAFTIVIL